MYKAMMIRACLLTGSIAHLSSAQPQIVDLRAATGDPSFEPTAISADGNVVVGTVTTPAGVMAARWPWQGNLELLGTLPGGTWSRATSASGDGSIVVGSSHSADGIRGFIWSAAQGMESIGVLGGDTSSGAADVSEDGTTVVGQSSSDTSRAFRWRRDSGMAGIPRLFESAWAWAGAVNSDGTVIVGVNEAPLGGSQSFRWQEGSGLEAIPPLAGSVWTGAKDVSADGSVAIGYSYLGMLETYVWSSGSPIRRMGRGTTDGYNLSPEAISGDGHTIIGRMDTVLGQTAFVWSQSTCTVDLGTFALSQGLNVSSLWIQRALSISDDGSSMVGYGYVNGNYQVLLIRGLNFSSVACNCINFNNNGASFDPEDIEAFLSIYSEGPCVPESADCGEVDFNNDGSSFDPCDIASFLTVYSEGPCTPCGE